MFGKKKKKEPEDEEESSEEGEGENPPEESSSSDGDISIGRLTADLEKLKAKFSTFYELNKSATERFTRISEQIGELRAMILERDKESKMLEAKATQAIDMVQTVQPDKLMIEVRKQDAKIESLRAGLESNGAIINNAMSELKNIRNKMQAFTGMEQAIKLNEEVTGELMEIKKTNATVERHADKSETIFSEMQKRFSEFEKFADNLKDLEKSSRDLASDMDSLKTRSTNFADKKEIEGIIIKFNSFEKHVSGVMTLVNRKFESLEKDFSDKFNEKIEKIEKLLTGFEELAKKTPDLDKYFNLLEEESKKTQQKEVKVEKIKVLGEEEKEKTPSAAKKTGVMGKLMTKLVKKQES